MSRKPGDVFVHRNIANQFQPTDDSANSVLSYAVEHLGVEHVLVVGHTRCGGVAAAYDASLAARKQQSRFGLCYGHKPTPPKETSLSRWLNPLTDLATSLRLHTTRRETALHILVEENVRKQVDSVCSTDVIRNAWKRGRDGKTIGKDHHVQKPVWVHGWVYELESGLLRDLQVSRGPSSLHD